MNNAMLSADLGSCKNLTVKFGGFPTSNHTLDPINKINSTTWMINQHELVPDLFRQFGPSISNVSVCFDNHLEPSSESFSKIVNNAAVYGTDLMASFELINWRPCIGGPRTLMGLAIRPVNTVRELTIYDSVWSPIMIDEINRIFPNLRRLKLLRIIFKNHDKVPIKRLKNVKEIEIQIQLQDKYLQKNIFGLLIAHPNLEHVTLAMDGRLKFWQTINQKLTKVPSLKLAHIPTSIAGCNGNLTFSNEKVHLVISPATEQFECKFDRLKELTLSDAAHFRMFHSPNNRDLMPMWLDFIVANEHIEKLNIFVGYRWIKKENLTMIFKNLPCLTKLAILDCDILMSNIVETLFLSQSIEKIHLINYGGLNDMKGVLGWAIGKDKNNNILIKKI